MTGYTTFIPYLHFDKNDIEWVCLFEKLLEKVQYTLNRSITVNVDGNMCMKLNDKCFDALFPACVVVVDKIVVDAVDVVVLVVMVVVVVLVSVLVVTDVVVRLVVVVAVVVVPLVVVTVVTVVVNVTSDTVTRSLMFIDLIHARADVARVMMDG